MDEEAIRLLEERHPGIEFNWPQILRGDEEVPAPAHGGRADAASDHRRAAEQEPGAPEPASDEPVTPAHARLGSEGLARLRARYAEVLAAISARVPDEQRREALREQAEALDPDSWVTDEEVAAGLEGYERALGALRDVLGRRRRKRSRRDLSARPDGAATDGESDDAAPDGNEAES